MRDGVLEYTYIDKEGRDWGKGGRRDRGDWGRERLEDGGVGEMGKGDWGRERLVTRGTEEIGGKGDGGDTRNCGEGGRGVQGNLGRRKVDKGDLGGDWDWD